MCLCVAGWYVLLRHVHLRADNASTAISWSQPSPGQAACCWSPKTQTYSKGRHYICMILCWYRKTSKTAPWTSFLLKALGWAYFQDGRFFETTFLKYTEGLVFEMIDVPPLIIKKSKILFLFSQDKKAPVFALDLMSWCWQQEADHRPTSSQLFAIASTLEFPRLADVLTFDKRLIISCAVTAGSRVSLGCCADGRPSVGSDVWMCRNELNAGIGTGKINVMSFGSGRCTHKEVRNIVRTLRNDDRNSNDDGCEKSHFWFAFYFLCGSLGFCFFALNFLNR